VKFWAEWLMTQDKHGNEPPLSARCVEFLEYTVSKTSLKLRRHDIINYTFTSSLKDTKTYLQHRLGSRLVTREVSFNATSILLPATDLRLRRHQLVT
jgi:hypothetical protein